MKCPNCKTGMEKGILTNNGTRWAKGNQLNLPKFLDAVTGLYVLAWHCPKCGKIELKIAEKE